MRFGRAIFACLLLGLAAWAATPLARADDYTVSAFIQPERGITDTQMFQFVIQVEGESNPQVRPPQLPKLVNLTVVRGPSQNTKVAWSPGRSSVNFQLIYTMLADGPGRAEIPSIALDVNSETYRTEPITIEIAKSSARPQPATPRVPAPRQEPETADVFLRAELSSDRVWVGQSVSLSVLLYTTQRVSNLAWHQEPSFPNFWVETLEVDPEGEAYRTKSGNRIYRVHPIERKVLMAPSPGTFRIDPYVGRMQVRQAGSDLFDLFNRGRSQAIVRKSEPLTLEVRPLPAGEPSDFSGAVGEFALEAKLDRVETQVNDAVALTVTVRGDGSLRGVKPPSFLAPSDVKVFDPEVTESHSITKGRMRSKKTWEWILVPLAPGEIKFPELRFSYFDPDRGAYRAATAGTPMLSVRRGEAGDAEPGARGGIQARATDLHFIKPLRHPLEMERRPAHEGGLFLVLLFAPVGLVPLAVLLSRQRHRLLQDRGLARARRARSRARKRFQSVRKRLETAESAEFHEEVARALVGYVADRFNRSETGLTYDLADELLASREIDASLRQRFRVCLETCDFARYVPSAGQAERRTEVLAEAENVVESLERAP